MFVPKGEECISDQLAEAHRNGEEHGGYYCPECHREQIDAELRALTITELGREIYRHVYGPEDIARELLRRLEMAEDFRLDTIATCEEILRLAK